MGINTIFLPRICRGKLALSQLQQPPNVGIDKYEQYDSHVDLYLFSSGRLELDCDLSPRQYLLLPTVTFPTLIFYFLDQDYLSQLSHRSTSRYVPVENYSVGYSFYCLWVFK